MVRIVWNETMNSMEVTLLHFELSSFLGARNLASPYKKFYKKYYRNSSKSVIRNSSEEKVLYKPYTRCDTGFTHRPKPKCLHKCCKKIANASVFKILQVLFRSHLQHLPGSYIYWLYQLWTLLPFSYCEWNIGSTQVPRDAKT